MKRLFALLESLDDPASIHVQIPFDPTTAYLGGLLVSTSDAAVDKADLSFPIDILKNKGRWLVLDGLHRLVKSYMQKKETVKVRIIPRERLPEILTGEPIELPAR